MKYMLHAVKFKDIPKDLTASTSSEKIADSDIVPARIEHITDNGNFLVKPAGGDEYLLKLDEQEMPNTDLRNKEYKSSSFMRTSFVGAIVCINPSTGSATIITAMEDKPMSRPRTPDFDR